VEQSDTVQIAALLFAFLGTVFTGVMAYLMARLNQKQAAAAVEVQKVAVHAQTAAVKVAEVKDVLVTTQESTDRKLVAIAAVGEKTLAYVNSAMGRALHTNMLSTRTASDASPGDVALAHVADEAKRLYEEHERAQRKVDEIDSASKP
jgi:hypothetical protein